MQQQVAGAESLLDVNIFKVLEQLADFLQGIGFGSRALQALINCAAQ